MNGVQSSLALAAQLMDLDIQPSDLFHGFIDGAVMLKNDTCRNWDVRQTIQATGDLWFCETRRRWTKTRTSEDYGSFTGYRSGGLNASEC